MHPDLAQAVTDLPLWIQILATAVGLAIGAYGLFTAQFRSMIPRTSTDVIVPQMTIADSQALRDLAEEMKRWAIERQGRRSVEMDLLIEMRKLNDGVDEINTRMIENEVLARRDRRGPPLTKNTG